MIEPDPLGTPNCPICLRPMEPVEAEGSVVMWDCGYCDLDRDAGPDNATVL